MTDMSITGEILEQLPATTGLYAAVAAQIDKQISTARAFPRNMATVGTSLGRWVTTDDATAESCIYSLSRGGKTIRGPSIRFAEILAHAWGHLRIDARIVDEGKDFLVVRGECHDLQTNNVWAQDVTRRLTNSSGRRYDADLIGVTFMAAASIAQRDSVLKCVPAFIWRPAFEAVQSRITGDVKTLADRRIKAVGQFSLVGVTPAMIFKRLNVSGLNDIGPDHLVDLIGTFQAIRDGQTSVESEFGDIPVPTRALGGSPLSQSEDTGAIEGEAKAGQTIPEPKPRPDPAPKPNGGVKPPAEDRPPANGGSVEPKSAVPKERKSKASRQDRDTDLPAQSPDPAPAPREDEGAALLRKWEEGCLAANSILELRTFASTMGPDVAGRWTEEQEAMARDMYDAAQASLEAIKSQKEKAQAAAAYAAAKGEAALDKVERAYENASPQEKQEPVGEAFDDGEAELERYGLVADIMPEDDAVLTKWKIIIDSMLDAPDAQGVMDAYTKAETGGLIASLPEMAAFHLRTARFRIKNSKASK